MQKHLNSNHLIIKNLEKAYSDVYRGESLGNQELRTRIDHAVDRYEFLVWKVTKGDRVLDVGCGNGFVLYNLRYKFKELCGIELSEGRAEITKRTLEGLNHDIRIGAFEIGTEWPDDYFDCIITADTIEHVIDVRGFLKECFRILKPEGSIIIATPNVAKLRNRIRLLIGRFPSTAAPNEGIDTRNNEQLLDGGHVHYFTFRMLKLLLEESGFIGFRKFGIGRFKIIHAIWPTLLSGSVAITAIKQNISGNHL
jgi:SAM-dependent methyltransferase